MKTQEEIEREFEKHYNLRNTLQLMYKKDDLINVELIRVEAYLDTLNWVLERKKI